MHLVSLYLDTIKRFILGPNDIFDLSIFHSLFENEIFFFHVHEG